MKARPAFAVFAATLAAYWPAIGGGFIWDDDGHVTRPELQSLHGLWRIWTELGATQQYYPVLHSAFWLEHRLWGDAPVGYHLVNILLHATAACLFGVILKRLAVPGAVLAAFIFALHPVGVESVAWISEQKNTLSAVFYLLAAWVYLGKNKWHGLQPMFSGEHGLKPVPLQARNVSAYFLSTFLFILAVLTKSVTATLPGALLVILWWKNGRLSWKRDMLPLVPWFAIGAAAGLLTAWVERTYVGAEGAAFHLSLLERGLLAGRVIWFYLGKLVWPSNLIFIYPHWNVSSAVGWQYLFPVGVLGLLAVFWLIRKRSRAPLAALLFFAGSLFPALGFFNVYPFVFSYVADHFQYLAMMGVIAAAAAAIGKAEVGRRKAEGAGVELGYFRHFRLPPSYFRLSAAFLLLAVLGTLTWRQCRMYRDVQTLYETTLAKNPDAWLAHLNLGNILLERGSVGDAMSHYREALRLNPDYADIHFNMGKVLIQQGRMPEAMEQFADALRINPRDAQAHNNLGIAFAGMGRMPEAVVQFEDAVRLNPAYAKAHSNLGGVLAGMNRLPEAEAQYREALRLEPGLAESHYNLGLALAQQGRIQEARVEFGQALRLKPDYKEARERLERLPMSRP